MATLGLWLLLSAVQTIVVPRDRLGDPVRVPCPVDQTTRIVFPEPLRRFRTLPGEDLGLGVTVESTKPRGVIVVHAATHPTRRTVEFRGPGLTLTLLLESVAGGGASEVRLVVADAPAPSPSPGVPSPVPAAPESPPPASTPAGGGSEPADPGGTPPPGFFTPADLLRVTAVRIQRREGLPGQNPMVLVDALRGDDWIWLRFRLEGGAASRVAGVSWEQGAITRYIQQADEGDLRIVVQLPRGSVTRKTRVSVKLESGPAYRFALNSSTFPNFVRDLFKE